MDDQKIVDLYCARSESAITETSNKYSKYCYYISNNILHNREDAEECVSDTYLKAWNNMPPQRPNCLSAFLGKITHNLSLDKFKMYTAEKRGSGQTELVLSELEECASAAGSIDDAISEMILVQCIDDFLSKQPKINRRVFVRRYWYLSAIKEIAEQYGMTESKVKSILFRMRNELKFYLEKEGIML